ncbi:DUF1279 super [Savitreella phatthalungensis]
MLLCFLVPRGKQLSVARTIAERAGFARRRLSTFGARLNSTEASGPGQRQTIRDTSLSGKLKHLSSQYGRAAIVVYLGISLVDFAFALALVHSFGAARIKAVEHSLLDVVRRYTGWNSTKGTETKHQPEEDAVQENGSGFWTQVAIAYGIHKALFIFIRVPITIAITPTIVKALQRRGYQIGKAQKRVA